VKNLLVLFLLKRNEKKNRKANLSNIPNAIRCQILGLRDHRLQFNIKMLSRGLW